MTEPTTAAGRATVEAFYQYTAVEDRDLVRDYILAIEAEARAEERAACEEALLSIGNLAVVAAAEARAAALDEANQLLSEKGQSWRFHCAKCRQRAALAIDALREDSGNPAKG